MEIFKSSLSNDYELYICNRQVPYRLIVAFWAFVFVVQSSLDYDDPHAVKIHLDNRTDCYSSGTLNSELSSWSEQIFIGVLNPLSSSESFSAIIVSIELNLSETIMSALSAIRKL